MTVTETTELRAVRIGERQDTPRAIAFLNAIYEKNGVDKDSPKAKIEFLRARLGGAFCASASGCVSESNELAALERALLADEL